MTGHCCGVTGSQRPSRGDRHRGSRTKVQGSTAGMALIPGGRGLLGAPADQGYASDGEYPMREVMLTPYWIDRCAVTNAEFRAFVEATQYRTTAESDGASFVFSGHLPVPLAAAPALPAAPWWRLVEGADWAHPEGPGTDVRRRDDHPVVHVSWDDACAFASWTGKRLPTEAEWEFAARGGLVAQPFPWGSELQPGGEHRMNVWQGEFPDEDTGEDGYAGTAPVHAYHPNAFGLYNMTGNVWEWCADLFETHPHKGSVIDPRGPTQGSRRVLKGGSFLCHESYCRRYRTSARSGNTPTATASHTGFRCALGFDPDAPLRASAATQERERTP